MKTNKHFNMLYGKQQTNSMQLSLGRTIHPNQITNAQFLDEFLNWFPDHIIEHRNLIITGDINLHLNNLEHPDGSTFVDSLDVLGVLNRPNTLL